MSSVLLHFGIAFTFTGNNILTHFYFFIYLIFFLGIQLVFAIENTKRGSEFC